MKEIHGSGVALITCFNNDLSIDYAFLSDGSLNGIEKNHLLSVSISAEQLKKYFSNKTQEVK